MSTSKPLNVLVSGAAGQIACSMIPLIANGCVFGEHQKVALRLLEITPVLKKLKGVAMEIEDGAYPLIEETIITDDLEVACKDLDYAILIGGFSVKGSWKNFERDSLLGGNVPIFSKIGAALDAHAKKTVKVLVVANPANTNAYITMKYAPSIPKKNFSALSRLDHNRAISKLRSLLKASGSSVKNVAIFGNHSRTQVCDTSKALVGNKSLEPELNDPAYLKTDFQEFLRDRFYQIVEHRGVTSSISAANAAKDHIRNWFLGTSPGEHVSMCVVSDGNPYGMKEGLIFSCPVSIKDGEWSFVGGYDFSPEMEQALRATEAELVSEKEKAESLCK